MLEGSWRGEKAKSRMVSGPAFRCGNATLTNGTTARPQFSTITGQSGHYRGNLDCQLLNIRDGDEFCLVCDPCRAEGRYFIKADIREDSNNMQLVLDIAMVANHNQTRRRLDVQDFLNHIAS
ncbi:hypothetical protein QR685DRAFT_575502 [Neurospora intermedia]|uniref:Uncharacterized protein n=1 Tax=Neurospora intermedia TaxID=5142 RepID=A0ABR3D100_NEUIN